MLISSDMLAGCGMGSDSTWLNHSNAKRFKFNKLFRACLEALVSAEDRKVLLRILKRHIPETVSTVLVGHFSN